VFTGPVRPCDRAIDRRGCACVPSSSFVVIEMRRMRVIRRFVFCARRCAPIASRVSARDDGRMDSGHENVRKKKFSTMTTDDARADAFDGALTRRRFFYRLCIVRFAPKNVVASQLRR
jgi:hypothetical protein